MEIFEQQLENYTIERKAVHNADAVCIRFDVVLCFETKSYNLIEKFRDDHYFQGIHFKNVLYERCRLVDHLEVGNDTTRIVIKAIRRNDNVTAYADYKSSYLKKLSECPNQYIHQLPDLPYKDIMLAEYITDLQEQLRLSRKSKGTDESS